MKTQKILVTGAGGQLGSELIRALSKRYDRKSIIATDVRDPEHIDDGHFDKLDVLDKYALYNFIKKNEITEIYHLAAILSATGEKNPRLAWRVNMDGLINVLDAAVELNIQKVYWPSSIAVFGPHTPKNNVPQHTIMDPATIYGISKLTGERWCEWYHIKYGLDIRSLRYPGLIGYRSKAGGGTTDYAVEIFLKAIMEKKYTSFLTADTYLPMMYMDDATKATLDLMEAPVEKITIRSSYNIAAMSFSPSEIATVIQKFIPEFQITYKPDFRQDIADSWPNSIDDSQARLDWNWQHHYDLEKMSALIIKELAVQQHIAIG